jgi:hypothetical protein
LTRETICYGHEGISGVLLFLSMVDSSGRLGTSTSWAQGMLFYVLESVPHSETWERVLVTYKFIMERLVVNLCAYFTCFLKQIKIDHGREDPVVWFPAVQQHISSTSMQTHPIALIPRPVQQTMSTNATKCTELKKKQRLERQRYFEGGTDADIQKCTAKLNGIMKRIAETERQINDIDSEALKKNVAEVHGSIPVAKLRWA